MDDNSFGPEKNYPEKQKKVDNTGKLQYKPSSK